MATGRHISLPKPFASGNVNKWCQRFEICSKANEWNDATTALKLPTLLEGEAFAVWMELTADEQKDYKMETNGGQDGTYGFRFIGGLSLA